MTNSNKERAEARQLEIFTNLYNQKYGTDYVIGPVEIQNSIVDRMAISPSKKWKNFEIQIKEVIELDTTEFTKSIMGKDVKVFDSNIFKLLTPRLEKIEKKYGESANGTVLVLSVGVSESWLRDYELPDVINQIQFEGVYCLGLPSSLNISGFIYSMKGYTPRPR